MKAQLSKSWLSEFNTRMTEFERHSTNQGLPISIKLRVESGCFCQSCCPEGHRIIADYLRQHPAVEKKAKIVEHESGPEILAYINLAAGVLTLAASVTSLIANIIQARSTGIERGDKRGHPFKLIIRRMDGQEFKEVVIMEIPPDADTKEILTKLLKEANRIKASKKTKKTVKQKKK